ncbi:MAG: BolA/IbaG family iron-sulfur metabolism protein [Halolamina sp.]
MDPGELERLIEAEIPDAEATASTPRAPDEDHEDAHFAVAVVSPAFEEKSLVEQHDLVYDAVGDRMTTEVHALEITTRTPEEA